MNTYKIFIKFKNGKDLEIDLESNNDVRDTLQHEILRKDKILLIGDFYISREDILFINIKGETLKGGEILEG